MTLEPFRPEWKKPRSVKRERRLHPDGGKVVLLAISDGYAMVRRPGCIPFVVRETEWRSWQALTK
jgi:hypothetical protein